MICEAQNDTSFLVFLRVIKDRDKGALMVSSGSLAGVWVIELLRCVSRIVNDTFHKDRLPRRPTFRISPTPTRTRD